MKQYDDGRISFPVLENWQVSKDDSGNILYIDPLDRQTWCFVVLEGVKQRAPEQPLPSAKNFLAGCYEKELAAGEASILELDAERAMIDWSEATVNNGIDFTVFHFHIASRVGSGDIQLADFSLAVPDSARQLPKVAGLQKMVQEQATLAQFHVWSKTS